METPPPLPVVLCLSALIDGLFDAVCARYGVYPIRGPLIRFLWKRLFRIKLLFGNLAARFSAGKDLSPRSSRPARARAPRRPTDDHVFRLRRWVNPKFGWLRRIAMESIGAGAYAYALRALLTTDPDMLALLAATPATARILRPLCFMLGVALPPPPAVVARPPREERREPARDDAGARSTAIAVDPRTPRVPAPQDEPEDFSPVPVLAAA